MSLSDFSISLFHSLATRNNFDYGAESTRCKFDDKFLRV